MVSETNHLPTVSSGIEYHVRAALESNQFPLANDQGNCNLSEKYICATCKECETPVMIFQKKCQTTPVVYCTR
jgi:hypothetical protein